MLKKQKWFKRLLIPDKKIPDRFFFTGDGN